MDAVKTPTKRQAFSVLRNWLAKQGADVRGDARVISHKEWNDRGEEYGRDALCVMVIDGSPLYDDFNYGEFGWTFHADLNKTLEASGLWFDMLYGWALGIYPK